jgi:hypothetical protein
LRDFWLDEGGAQRMVTASMDVDTVRQPQTESAEVMSETIAGVEVPDTAAVAEATRLVQETTPRSSTTTPAGFSSSARSTLTGSA